MSARNDGGPAFPTFSIDPWGKPVIDPGSVTLCDWYIAHAPAEPQPWFEPVMREKPRIPYWSDIEDLDARSDVRLADEMETDPTTDIGRAFVEMRSMARADLEAWEKERRKQRYIQWPAAWADEQIRMRGQG